MKIVEINAVPYGSTGKIMFSVADILKKQGHEVFCTSGFSWTKCQRDDYVITSGFFLKSIHIALATLTGMNGCFSVFPTGRLIKRLKAFQPDVIHLHNLHGNYVNLPMLFSYIKRYHIRVVWTLHDCWAITGQCPHFTMVKCDKWKRGCYQCPQYREYPATIVDCTKTMWKLKRKWFNGVGDMTIVTPSQWLADLVKESYLRDYHVKVIYNGIDLSVFKPTNSNFREKYGISVHKQILLGVAYGWDKRKGLDVFVELANRLDNEKYQIVLVGTDDAVTTQLPENIITINRTQNQQELVEVYTAADLFVNPTREEVLGLVNIESLACGTPVITFRSGGSPECIDNTCGGVVDCDDVDAMEQEIVRICSEKPYPVEACLERAQMFNMSERFKEYYLLIEEKCNETIFS